MQFGKTIIVTLVAALTLGFATEAKAQMSFGDFLCAAFGAAVGGVIGNQFGKGHGNTAATIAGAGFGTLGGLEICHAIQTEQDRQAYNQSVSSCVQENTGCQWQSSTGHGQTRIVKAGHWVNDVGRQCQCQEITVYDCNGNPVKQVICQNYQVVGRHWVADKIISESEVIPDAGSETNASYVASLTLLNQARARTKERPCYDSEIPPDFFQHRYAYVNNNCVAYMNDANPSQLSDGTTINGAEKSCDMDRLRSNDGHIKSCTAVVVDHQFIH